MAEACVSCEIVLNNDIMGIGVRAALYAQIIIAWFMSLKYPDTFVKNSRASYMIATGLLVASLIQWKTQELGLLDALVVSFMTSMMTVFIVVSGTTREEVKPTPRQPDQKTDTSLAEEDTPAADSQPPITFPSAHTNQPSPPTADQTDAQASDIPEAVPRPRRSNTQWFILFCFVNLWGGFCLSVWKDPTHFGLKGLKANCTTNNDVTVWLFGVEVHAVHPGTRIAALVLISVLYFIALCSLFFTLEDVLHPTIRMFRLIGSSLTTESPKEGNTTSETVTPRSLHEDPMINKVHYSLHVFAIGTLVYLLISTELTIHKNDKKGATKDWSYGQVIALVLLLQQLMDIGSTVVEAREERKLKKEQEEYKQKAQLSQAGAQQPGDIPMKVIPTPITTLSV